MKVELGLFTFFKSKYYAIEHKTDRFANRLLYLEGFFI